MNKPLNDYWKQIRNDQNDIPKVDTNEQEKQIHKGNNLNKAKKFSKRPWANKSAKDMLNNVSSQLEDDYKSRRTSRKWLFYGLLAYFLISSILIALFVCFSGQNYRLKAIIVSGFFVHLIGLFAIEFKYAFSSSREFSGFAVNLLKWVNNENGLEWKYQELDHKMHIFENINKQKKQNYDIKAKLHQIYKIVKS